MKHSNCCTVLLLSVAAALAQTPGSSIPATGKDVPALAPYENALRVIMDRWSVPGAAFAITDGSRLVYARGLGFADREAGTLVQPTSRFRLASISKTIAGMTILKLAEEGKINLDKPFMDYIPDLKATTTPPPDVRMTRVTIRQLLQHTGGWDRDEEDDHVSYYNTASRLFNLPVSIDLMTRYIMSQRLEFDPGTKYAYSNSGYQVLGRIIERVTGKKFLDAVQDKILGPAGAANIRIGGNLLSDRFSDEVKYYDYPGAPLSTTQVAPGAVVPTPRPYNRRVDMADSYGGLIGNTIDLMRYLLALEGRRGPALLSNATLTAMTARPAPPVWPATGNYVGTTWRIIPTTGGVHWWHSGGASGTRNLLVRRLNGRSWVVLMNTRPQNEDQIITDLFNAMAAAESQVTAWPTHDLFADYAGPTLNTSAETLTFNHSFGSTPPPAQSVQVTSAPGAANLTIDQPTAAWLKLDKLSGATPLSLSVSVEPAGLVPGEYQSQLRITAPNAANGPRLVRAVLNVTPPPAFSAIRNPASLAVVTTAAPASRLIVEAADLTAVRIVDSVAPERVADILSASQNQVELLLPADLATGSATIRATTSKGLLLEDKLRIAAAAPALYTANRSGAGAALATVIRTAEDGSTSSQSAYTCGEDPANCTATAIDLGAETDKVDIVVTATGARGAAEPGALTARVGDEAADVIAVVAADAEPGIDWITVRLPRTLIGRGEVDLTVAFAGSVSNAVKLLIQ
ncbi:MAG: serine hydrolase [Bryobacterales bacterium]|nr:serine hydrolase [Bryobacterales bacterium]